jgi:hypothetical protein
MTKMDGHFLPNLFAMAPEKTAPAMLPRFTLLPAFETIIFTEKKKRFEQF